MAFIESKKPPTSPSGVANAGKQTIGYAWFFALIAFAFGIYTLALPWLAMIPWFGRFFSTGDQIYPSHAQQAGRSSTNSRGVRYP